MSVGTLARDDFRNTRRSSIVLGVVGAFTAFVALIFIAEISIYDDAYRALFDVMALVAMVLPLLVASLTYLAVAGDRESGTITYVLGLPNRRRDYLVAKYVSRASVAVAAVVLGTGLGFAVAATTFVNGADPVRFATFGALSSLYAVAMTSLFLAISAATASRARAMFGVIASYFVLIPFWIGFMPVLSIGTLVNAIGDVLGLTPSQTAMDLLVSVSPTYAYFQSTEYVFAGVTDQYPVFTDITSRSGTVPAEPWFLVLVLVAWTVVPVALAYLRFRRAEIA